MNYYYICIICTYFPLYIVLTAVFQLQVVMMSSVLSVCTNIFNTDKNMYILHATYLYLNRFLSALKPSAIWKFWYGSWMRTPPLLPQNTHWKQWVKHLFIDILYMQYFHNHVVSMYGVRIYAYVRMPVHSSFCNICCIKIVTNSARARVWEQARHRKKLYNSSYSREKKKNEIPVDKTEACKFVWIYCTHLFHALIFFCVTLSLACSRIVRLGL